MASILLPWGNGTSDHFTVVYSGNVCSSQMTVTSDPNLGTTERNKTVTFRTAGGAALLSFVITQLAGERAYSIAYNEDYG
jgi:hypothetical protein